jgi:WD40 repeat protein
MAVPLVAADKVTYQDQILPIFRNKCLKCHNADKMKADLDLSTYDAAMQGSGNGPVLVGGDPDESKLYKAVAHLEKPTMPPKDKLPENEIELIKKWVAGGLLMNSGSKAMIAAKPKVNLALDPDSLGKRPEGPPPMPNEVFALDSYIRTARTSVSTGMAVSPWSPLIAIGGQRQVLLYNTDTLSIAGIIPFNEGFPHSMKFSANGKLLIIGGGRGANLGISTVWDITKGEQILTVGDDLDVVLATDISPDQRFIAHGGPDRFLRIFSTETGEVVHKIKKHTDWVTAVRFSTDGKYVASGDRNGGLHVWETEPGQRVCSFSHGNRVTGFEWATTNILVSASMDGSSKIFNVDEARQLKSWSTHSGGASSLARTMSGLLVTSGRNKRATLWDGNGGKKRDFVFPGDIPSQAVPSHDGKLVIGSDWNGIVYVWNAADGKEIKRLSLNPEPVAEQYAAALKVVEEKVSAVKAAETAHKAALDKIAKTKAQMTALDTAVTMRQKAVSDSKAALDKLAPEKQKPAQAAVVASDKALADAKAANNAEAIKAAQAKKATADKALAAINNEVTQATTVNSAANKALVNAQNAAKTGKAALTKQIADLTKATTAEQAKVTAAGAALKAAQKDADLLHISKSYSEYYNTRKELTEQEAKLAGLQAAAKAAQAALDNTKEALEIAQKTDVKVLKSEKLAAFNKAKENKTASDQTLAAARADVAREQTKVDAATKAIATAEAGVKTAAANLETAKAVHIKSTADAKLQSEKAKALKAAYDQLVAAKQVPSQQINAAIAKAMTQANAAKVNATKAVSVINAEVATANTAFTNADGIAKSAEAAATTSKSAMDKLAADMAKQKTDLATRQKGQAAVKTAMEKLIAEKQKPAEAKVAAAVAALKQAPLTKSAADKAQAATNGEVKAALNGYLAAEMAAQAAEAAAGNDAAKQAEASAKRKAADTAKTMLDKLISGNQKTVLAQVTKANSMMKSAPIAKAAADKELAAVKAEVAKATTAHAAAAKAATGAQTLLKTTSGNHTKAKADYLSKQTDGTNKRSLANSAKAKLEGLIATKQKPAQAAVDAVTATVNELAIAKTAGAKVLARVNAEMAEAKKPVVAASAIVATVEAAVKAAEANVVKMTAAMITAQQEVAKRKQEADVAKAAMAMIAAEKVEPMELRVTAAAVAMVQAQVAHEDAEQNHKARVTLLSKTMENQTAGAKSKHTEADQFAIIVTEARKRVEQLKTEYDKLKSASKPEKVSATTVSK